MFQCSRLISDFLWECEEMSAIPSIAAGVAASLTAANQVHSGCVLTFPGKTPVIGVGPGPAGAPAIISGPRRATCTWTWNVIGAATPIGGIPAVTAGMDWSSVNCGCLPAITDKPGVYSPMPAGTTFTRPCSN